MLAPRASLNRRPAYPRRAAMVGALALAALAWTPPPLQAVSEQESPADEQPQPRPEDGALKVDVYPRLLQEKALLYDEYRSKVPADKRDPLKEAALAADIAGDLLLAGALEDAEDFLRKALEQLPESVDPLRNALARADLEHALAYLAEMDGAYQKRTRRLLAAEKALRAVLPADHPVVLVARLRAGRAELEEGFQRVREGARRDMLLDGLRRLTRTARDAERRLGPASPTAVKARLALAVGSAMLNRSDRAVQEIDVLIARLDENKPEQRFLKAAALAQKAKLLHWLDRSEEAGAAIAQAAALAPADRLGGPVPIEEFAPAEYAQGKKAPTLRSPRRATGVSTTAGSVAGPGGLANANDLAGGAAPVVGVTARDFASSTSGSWLLASLCIDAEGKVLEAEMLDHGGPSAAWAKNAFALLKQRRYLPMKGLGPGECAPQMIRLAEVSERRAFLGSRIRHRSLATAVRRIDLAKDNPLSGGYVAAGLAAAAPAAQESASGGRADAADGN